MTTIDSTLDKVLPHSDEAERSILGAVLQKNHLFNHAAEVLSRDDFYMDRHQVIFTAMGELSEKTRPIDLLTLKDELQRKELLEASGGVAYLASLIDGVPVVDNIDAYTRMVKERSILRKLIYLSNQLMNRCFEDQEEALDILEAAEQQIFQIAQEKVRKGFVALQPLAKETYKYLQDLSEQKLKTTGIATGFTDLDTLTSGLQRSDLIIVAARPAMGKTSFCLNVAQHAAIVQEKVVGILSLEMSAPQIVMRLLCSLARVDAHKMRTGHLGHEDWARLATALDQLSKARIFIDDSATLSIVELRSKARRLKTEHRLDLLIVDYLQLISAKGENRTQEISAISRALKGLAKELEIPVVALSQLSRAPEHRRGDHRPQLSDLRESGCLTGETLVYLPDKGTYDRMDSLVGERRFRVIALNTRTWNLEPRLVTNTFPTGRKPVCRLRTRLGKTVRATANHKFLTIAGWRRLDELQARTRIAIPRSLASFAAQSMSSEQLALLGHMIGDGCALPKQGIHYTSGDRTLAETVANLATSIFGDAVAPRISRERRWYQVYLSAGFHLTHGRRNPVAAWLDDLGVFGLRSYEKRIPDKVFAQPEGAIACFLRHLWATDGCIHLSSGKSHYANVYYATSSPILAQQVQSLLLRLGITARLSRRAQGGKGRDQYHVTVSGKPAIVRFLESVGGLGGTKSTHETAIAAHLSKRVANTNRDIIPLDVWRNLVVPGMAGSGLTSRQMQAALGTAYCGSALYKANMSRDRAAKVAEIVGSRELEKLARSAVYWDEITAIEPDGVEDVYDLTVEGLHNFVANDVIVHNSIEQDADVVMFIFREEEYKRTEENQGKAQIILGKQRNGPTDSFELAFLKPFTKFENLWKGDE